MGKGMLEKIIEGQGVADLYDYWLSTHGKIPPRQEPEIPNWALDTIFSNADKETGKIEGQRFDFFYHGTTRSLQKPIEQQGLRFTEGAACFTRRITHALENFSLAGNYTAIGNRSIDSEISKLVKQGIVSRELTVEEKAKTAFEYWCRAEIRENLGLLTVWRPPEEMVALDKKDKKIHKWHFALYQISKNKGARHKRTEFPDKKSERLNLKPEYLLAELKPTLELRLLVAKLEQDFAHGKDVVVTPIRELRETLSCALLQLSSNYSENKFVEDILISVAEGYILGLVRAIVGTLIEGRIPQKRIEKLKKLVIPFGYLRQYQNTTLSMINNKVASVDKSNLNPSRIRIC